MLVKLFLLVFNLNARVGSIAVTEDRANSSKALRVLEEDDRAFIFDELHGLVNNLL